MRERSREEEDGGAGDLAKRLGEAPAMAGKGAAAARRSGRAKGSLARSGAPVQRLRNWVRVGPGWAPRAAAAVGRRRPRVDLGFARGGGAISSGRDGHVRRARGEED